MDPERFPKIFMESFMDPQMMLYGSIKITENLNGKLCGSVKDALWIHEDIQKHLWNTFMDP